MLFTSLTARSLGHCEFCYVPDTISTYVSSTSTSHSLLTVLVHVLWFVTHHRWYIWVLLCWLKGICFTRLQAVEWEAFPLSVEYRKLTISWHYACCCCFRVNVTRQSLTHGWRPSMTLRHWLDVERIAAWCVSSIGSLGSRTLSRWSIVTEDERCVRLNWLCCAAFGTITSYAWSK